LWQEEKKNKVKFSAPFYVSASPIWMKYFQVFFLGWSCNWLESCPCWNRRLKLATEIYKMYVSYRQFRKLL